MSTAWVKDSPSHFRKNPAGSMSQLPIAAPINWSTTSIAKSARISIKSPLEMERILKQNQLKNKVISQHLAVIKASSAQDPPSAALFAQNQHSFASLLQPTSSTTTLKARSFKQSPSLAQPSEDTLKLHRHQKQHSQDISTTASRVSNNYFSTSTFNKSQSQPATEQVATAVMVTVTGDRMNVSCSPSTSFSFGNDEEDQGVTNEQQAMQSNSSILYLKGSLSPARPKKQVSFCPSLIIVEEVKMRSSQEQIQPQSLLVKKQQKLNLKAPYNPQQSYIKSSPSIGGPDSRSKRSVSALDSSQQPKLPFTFSLKSEQSFPVSRPIKSTKNDCKDDEYLLCSPIIPVTEKVKADRPATTPSLQQMNNRQFLEDSPLKRVDSQTILLSTDSDFQAYSQKPSTFPDKDQQILMTGQQQLQQQNQLTFSPSHSRNHSNQSSALRSPLTINLMQVASSTCATEEYSPQKKSGIYPSIAAVTSCSRLSSQDSPSQRQRSITIRSMIYKEQLPCSSVLNENNLYQQQYTSHCSDVISTRQSLQSSIQMDSTQMWSSMASCKMFSDVPDEAAQQQKKRLESFEQVKVATQSPKKQITGGSASVEQQLKNRSLSSTSEYAGIAANSAASASNSVSQKSRKALGSCGSDVFSNQIQLTSFASARESYGGGSRATPHVPVLKPSPLPWMATMIKQPSAAVAESQFRGVSPKVVSSSTSLITTTTTPHRHRAISNLTFVKGKPIVKGSPDESKTQSMITATAVTPQNAYSSGREKSIQELSWSFLGSTTSASNASSATASHLQYQPSFHLYHDRSFQCASIQILGVGWRR